MSTDYAAGQTGGASSGTGSATQTAKDTAQAAQQEAAGVAQSAAESGRTVAHEAKDQARQVTAEAKEQARGLFDQARTEVSGQAGAQQKRLADGLRGLGDELARMADSSENGGLATDLARQVADRTGTAASWLDEREPGELITAVSDFARRRPGVFLAVAAGAGLLAGRLTRGLSAASDSGSDTSTSGTVGTTSGGYATGAGFAGDTSYAGDTGYAGTGDVTAAGLATGAGYAGGAAALGDDDLGTAGPLPTGSVADDASTVGTEGAWGTPASTVEEPDYLASSRAVYGEGAAVDDTVGGPAPVQTTPGGIPDDEAGLGGTATGEPWSGVEREDQR